MPPPAVKLAMHPSARAFELFLLHEQKSELLKGGYMGDYIGTTMGLLRGILQPLPLSWFLYPKAPSYLNSRLPGLCNYRVIRGYVRV